MRGIPAFRQVIFDLLLDIYIVKSQGENIVTIMNIIKITKFCLQAELEDYLPQGN